MSDVDLAIVCRMLEHDGFRTVSVVDATSPHRGTVAPQWLPIAHSDDAEERRLRALALWDRDFLDLIPDYAEFMRTRISDVRVCSLSDQGNVLLYLFDTPDPLDSAHIGWDRASFGDTEPVFWDSLPALARSFLREVHPGYTCANNWESGGLFCPRDMITMAEHWEEPDGIDGWYDNYWIDCEPIDSRRMLHVGQTHVNYMLSVSPDAPPGKGVVYYRGEVNLADFFSELDGLLMYGT